MTEIQNKAIEEMKGKQVQDILKKQETKKKKTYKKRKKVARWINISGSL